MDSQSGWRITLRDWGILFCWGALIAIAFYAGYGDGTFSGFRINAISSGLGFSVLGIVLGWLPEGAFTIVFTVVLGFRPGLRHATLYALRKFGWAMVLVSAAIGFVVGIHEYSLHGMPAL